MGQGLSCFGPSGHRFCGALSLHQRDTIFGPQWRPAPILRKKSSAGDSPLTGQKSQRMLSPALTGGRSSVNAAQGGILNFGPHINPHTLRFAPDFASEYGLSVSCRVRACAGSHRAHPDSFGVGVFLGGRYNSDRGISPDVNDCTHPLPNASKIIHTKDGKVVPDFACAVSACTLGNLQARTISPGNRISADARSLVGAGRFVLGERLRAIPRHGSNLFDLSGPEDGAREFLRVQSRCVQLQSVDKRGITASSVNQLEVGRTSFHVDDPVL